MHTNDVSPSFIPFNRTQRRDSSKICSMFWVTDSERVIDDHPTQPISMKVEMWREGKIRWNIRMARHGGITA